MLTCIKFTSLSIAILSTGQVDALGIVVNRSGMVTAQVTVDNAAGNLLPGQKIKISIPE